MVRLIIYTFKILIFATSLGALGVHYLLSPLPNTTFVVVLGAIILLGLSGLFQLATPEIEKS